jgi:hypothetical protein
MPVAIRPSKLVPGRAFKGELAKPIYPDLILESIIDRSWPMLSPNDIAYSEKERKLELLLREYGIDANNKIRWLLLARSLAEEFVPGFKVIEFYSLNPKGRPARWTSNARLILVEKVTEYIQAHGGTALNACRQLVRPRNLYAPLERAPKEKLAKALYKQYQLGSRSRRSSQLSR